MSNRTDFTHFDDCDKPDCPGCRLSPDAPAPVLGQPCVSWCPGPNPSGCDGGCMWFSPGRPPESKTTVP